MLRHLSALDEARWVDVVQDGSGEAHCSKRVQAEAQFLAGCTALHTPAIPEADDAQSTTWARERPAEDANVYLIGQRLFRLSTHIDRALKEAAASQGVLAAELLLPDQPVVSGPPYIQSPTQLQTPLTTTLGGIAKRANVGAVGPCEANAGPADGRRVLVRIKPRARKFLENILHTSGPLEMFQWSPL
ncbi:MULTISPECIES: hypothetical protein [Paraburkholderia]|uniref:Uncharacterized protein n=1 Tax=Paraburkholderia ferrariae TaxID=386056 RepID=A0ABU9RSB7_9BURK